MFAQKITGGQALRIAQNFLSSGKSGGASHVAAKDRWTTTPWGSGSLYIVNRGQDGGFVIVSGDSRTYSVLGYSDHGHVDVSAVPSSLADLLDMYRHEVSSVDGLSVAQKSYTPPTYTPVAPLLTSLWDQGDPYNLLTPCYVGTTHSATGCAATALAQILYYHRWPEHGTGQNSYVCQWLNNKTLTADFSQDTYDWDAMKPIYNVKDGTDSESSRQAVALLMRDCGYAMDMQYGAQSGAREIDVIKALVRHFDYDKGVAYYERQYFTQSEWDAVIRNEIASHRPVFSTGYVPSQGGHAFVFDGYDKDGFIHVNWGWSGMSNGYFRTTALTPPTQGTGGSNGGFNSNQRIIVGIQRPQPNSEKALQIVSEESTLATPSKGSKTRTFSLRLTGDIINKGWQDATVDFAFHVKDSAGNAILTLPVKDSVVLATDSTTDGFLWKGTALASLSDGSYTIEPVVRNHGGKLWRRVRDASYERTNRLRLTVSGNRCSFSSLGTFFLSASNLQTTKFYKGIKSQVCATITNNGEAEYNGPVRVALYNKTTGMLVATGDAYNIDLLPGESVDVKMKNTVSVDEGTYTLTIVDENTTALNTSADIEVLTLPQQSIALFTSRQLSFSDNQHVAKDDLNIDVSLSCRSGVYAGDISVYICDKDDITKIVGSFNPVFVMLEAGQTKTIHLTGVFENGIPGTTYTALLIDKENNSYITPKNLARCQFVLSDGQSTAIHLPTVDNGGTSPSVVYTIEGKAVGRGRGSLPDGVYIYNGKKFTIHN